MTTSLSGIRNTRFGTGLMLGLLAVLGAPALATELQVDISGFESDTGDVFVSVYSNKKDWLGENYTASKRVSLAENLQGTQLSVSFELEPGEYAVLLFHDVNDNGELDTRSVIPIPKEPIGLSRNKKPRFGPPKYKHARFDLGEERLTIPIVLQ